MTDATKPVEPTKPNKPASLGRRAFPALLLTGATAASMVALDHPSSEDGITLAAAPTATGATTPSTTGAASSPSESTTSPSSDDETTSTSTSATAPPSDSTVPSTNSLSTTPSLPGSTTATANATGTTTAAPTTRPATTRATAAPTTSTAPATTPPTEPPPVTTAPTTPPTLLAPNDCNGARVDGPTAETRWGPVQVVATFATNGALCNTEVLQYPADHRRSVQINERALPVIHDRVLAQGSRFDAVSGATVTSEGYRASLQAILDTR